MRGSKLCQAYQLSEVLTAFGQSMHVAEKSASIVDTCCWRKIWEFLHISSFSTVNLYRSVFIYLQRYFRKGFPLKNGARLSTLVIQASKESKIARCLSYMSCQIYGAALEKLAMASSRCAMIPGQVATSDWPKLPQPKDRPPACRRKLPGPELTLSPYRRNYGLDGSRYGESNLV